MERSMRQYESTHTLKDEIDGRERLEAANFDLKLRVHHLEDALKRFTHTDSLGVEVEEIANENTNLKLQVHQQKLELQERNIVLTKAKQAIEALKRETERLRALEGHNVDTQRAVEAAEERKDAVIKKLEARENEIVKDYQLRLANKEQEVEESRSQLNLRERQYAAKEELLLNMQKAMEDATSELHKANSERDEAQHIARSLTNAHEKAMTLDEEVTQLRAQVELYHMQTKEQDVTIEELRVALSERTAAQAAAVEDLRKTYYNELEETSRGLKHRAEITVGEDMASLKKCVAERDQELRELRRAMERDRERFEAMVSETTTLRIESKEDKRKCATLAEENARISEEVRMLRDSRTEAQEKAAADSAISEMNREKLESTTEALASAREALRVSEVELRSLQAEQKVLSVHQGDLKSKADFVESAARENERLKAEVFASEASLREAKLSLSHLEAEVVHLKAAEEERLPRLQQLQHITHVAETEKKRADEVTALLHAAETRASISLETITNSDRTRTQQDAILHEATRVAQKVLGHFSRWSHDLDLVLDGTVAAAAAAASASTPGVRVPDTFASPPNEVEEQLSEMLLSAERVDMKMSRVTRLRNHLVHQVQALSDATTQKHDTATRACQMAELRLDKAFSELAVSHGIVSRDHQIRVKELTENRSFKESVLAEHTERLRQNNDRIMELSAKLESETRTKEAMGVEMRELQLQLEEYSGMQHDAELVASLAQRMEDMEEIHLRLENVTAELSESNAARTTLEVQLAEVRGLLSGREHELARLESQVNELQQTQMDPQLAQRIQETQELVEDEVTRGGPHGTTRVPSAAALGHMVERLEEVKQAALVLTERSATTLQELAQLGGGAPTSAEVEVLEGRCGDNARAVSDLGVRLGALASEWREALLHMPGGGGGGRHMSRLPSSSLSTSQHSSHKGSHIHSTPVATSSGSVPGLPSPSPTTNRHQLLASSSATAPASPLAGPVFPASRVKVGASVPSSVIKHRGLQQHQHRARQRVHAASEQSAIAAASAQRSAQQAHASRVSQQHAARAHAIGAQNSSSAGMNMNPTLSPTPSTRFSQDSHAGGAVQFGARASGAATPLTAARASISRLTKLSSDLHSLAGKLDKFESRTLTAQSALAEPQ